MGYSWKMVMFFPGLYGDGIFPALSWIIPRLWTSQTEEQRGINDWMSSIRESIEHAFGTSFFHLFKFQRLTLLHNGSLVRKMVVNLFFALILTIACLKQWLSSISGHRHLKSTCHLMKSFHQHKELEWINLAKLLFIIVGKYRLSWFNNFFITSLYLHKY